MDFVWKKKSVMGGVIIILSLASALSVWQGIRNAACFSQDFQWDAARALLMRIDPYEASLSERPPMAGALRKFYEYFESIDAPQKMEANQFPSLLFLLILYALMPYRTAKFFWLFSNLFCSALVLWLFRQTFAARIGRFEAAALSLLMIAGTPWRNQIGVGQHTLFSLAFFLLAVFISQKGDNPPYPYLSGAALAVSYFKYTLTAPLALYFVYRKKWREFTFSVLIHIIGNIFGALWLKKSLIYVIIAPLKVASNLAGEGSIDIGALSGGAAWSMALTLIIMLALFILALKLPDGKGAEFFALLIFLSLIMTYHRTYDYFCLILAYAGVWSLLNENDDAGVSDRALSRPLSDLLLYGFWLLVIYFFFVLRLFHENSAALAAGATLYYLYTALFALKVLAFSRPLSYER